MNIAILGGTGKEGAGLATRWALVGHSIIIGSRDAERAKNKAAELREQTKKLPIMGESNAQAARLGTVIVVALPAQGLAATLPEVREGCRGKAVISTVVPLTFGGPRLFTPPASGSSAEEVQALLPDAKVVAAFHHIAAHELSEPERAQQHDAVHPCDRRERRPRIVPRGDGARQTRHLREVALTGDRDGGENEHELERQEQRGPALQHPVERAEPGHVVEPGQRDERDRDPRDPPPAHERLGVRRRTIAPGRGHEHVGLIHEPAHPGHDPQQVQPHRDERRRHDAPSARRATTRSTSARLLKSTSGWHDASSSTGCWPVATATATAPQPRAHSTSCGVSPMIVMRSKAKSWPRARARSRAMAGKRRRSASSPP